MKGILHFLFIGLIVSSCLENDFPTSPLVSDSDVINLDPSQRKEEFPNDQYRLIGITPGSDSWQIIVEYTGGCTQHRFFTHWEGKENTSTLARSVGFSILHDSRGDLCERLVRDTLSIDLNEVFDRDYSEDTIFINVTNAFTGTKVEVDPYLSRIAQDNSCDLSASLIGTTCNDGFWQNQWFLMDDSVGIYEKVWLKPVRASDNRIPTTGKYDLSVKLLFGFKFNPEPCEDLPDGKVIPVAITCMNIKN